VLVKQSDLEDFALKADGMTFNNFCLAEVSAERNGDLPVLKVKGCYRNRNDGGATFSLVVVGLDEDGDPLWACSLAGTALARDVGCLSEVSVSVPPDALKRTVSLRFRASVLPACPVVPASRAAGPSTLLPTAGR
jgi:hypothetical protein